MTRVLLALALLAASASPVLASGPSVVASDCFEGDVMGSVALSGIEEQHQVIVEPGNRVYEADGIYPLGPGDYTAYVVIPGVEIVLEQAFAICPQRDTPRATLPPTDTAPPPAVGGEDLLLRVVIFLIAASAASFFVLAARPQR